MKKRYFVNGIAALSMVAVAGYAGSALAAVNLNNGTGLTTYATEIAGQVAFSTTVEAEAGAVVPAGAIPYVKFSCDAAFAGAAPTLGFAPVGGTTSTNVLKSGGIGVQSATWETTIGVAPLAKKDLYQLNFLGPATIAVPSGDVVSCTYEWFETSAHWAQGNPAVTTTGTILKWGTGLLARAADTTCTGVSGCFSGNYATIDLTEDGKKFTGGKTSGLVASVNLNADLAKANPVGAPLTWGALVDATSAATKLEVSGDFSGATKVWAEPGNTCTSYTATTAGVVNADKNMVTFSNTQLATAWGVATSNSSFVWNGGGVCVTVDGTTVLEESTYTAKVYLKPGTGYNVPESVDIGLVGNVEDNGSSDHLRLVLTPGGAYAGFVRISHVGPDAGAVTLQLINDEGTKVLIDLADVEGQDTSELAANASTTQMPVSAIYAAAQAKDDTFATTGNGKLRIKVKSTSTTGVNASMYSLSKDGNSFTLIQE